MQFDAPDAPVSLKRSWPKGPLRIRRSERRVEAVRRRITQEQQLNWPIDYQIAPPHSILYVQRSVIEHCCNAIMQYSPLDTPTIRAEEGFSFAIESTGKTHATVKAEPHSNRILLTAWYENGAMFKPECHCFVPVTTVTMTLDNCNPTCGEIEYTYDHNFGDMQNIEYGNVCFNTGWENALCTIGFF